MNDEIYAGLLKMMDQFQDSGAAVPIRYENHPNLKILVEKYDLPGIAGKGDTTSKVTRLLTWLSDHTYHNGDYDGHIPNHAAALLDYSFDAGRDFGINCRALSIILTECLLALNGKARTVYIMPFSPYDGDNHVVCEAWIPEKQKWVMLDPTFGGYVKNKNGDILNCLELRKALANREEIVFSEDFNYNGDHHIDLGETQSYYTKDLFYLKCRELQTFYSEQSIDNRVFTFAPIGYDAIKAQQINFDYRIETQGNSQSLQRWIESKKQNSLLYCPIETLAGAPE